MSVIALSDFFVYSSVEYKNNSTEKTRYRPVVVFFSDFFRIAAYCFEHSTNIFIKTIIYVQGNWDMKNVRNRTENFRGRLETPERV